jgi:hypothetical protein
VRRSAQSDLREKAYESSGQDSCYMVIILKCFLAILKFFIIFTKNPNVQLFLPWKYFRSEDSMFRLISLLIIFGRMNITSLFFVITGCSMKL